MIEVAGDPLYVNPVPQRKAQQMKVRLLTVLAVLALTIVGSRPAAADTSTPAPGTITYVWSWDYNAYGD